MNLVRSTIPWGVVAGLALLPAPVPTALGGEKAQTSGAIRSEELPGSRLQSEAERVGTMNKLLRNRQFDVFRSGNSLGGAIDVSLPAPTTPIPNLDPKARQRMIEEYDRKKNWLAEPGSVKPREIEKAEEIESGGRQASEDDIPNFSRERGRSRRSRDEAAQRNDFEEGDAAGKPKGRKESRMSSDDARSDRRVAARAAQQAVQPAAQKAGREIDRGGTDAGRSKTVSEVLAADTDHKNWFKAPAATDAAGTFGFAASATRPGQGFEGFSGTATSAARSTGNPAISGAPSASELLGTSASGLDADPGRRFDPTVAPGSAFSTASTPEGGLFPKAGGGAFSVAPSSAPSSDGGFGAFGGGTGGAARGLEGAARSLFSAPSGDASSAIRSSPSFTPRPAVLSFPRNGPF